MANELPQRVQLSRRKGWRMPPNTIKVDRSTRWGNPYIIGEPIDLRCAAKWGFQIKHMDTQARDRDDAVHLFAHLIAFDGAAQKEIRDHLAGKNLACWCPLGEFCHADILLRWANSPET